MSKFILSCFADEIDPSPRIQMDEMEMHGISFMEVLTNLERISDHCANVAGCVMDMQQHDLTIHAVMRTAKPGNPEFDKAYSTYSARYVLAEA